MYVDKFTPESIINLLFPPRCLLGDDDDCGNLMPCPWIWVNFGTALHVVAFHLKVSEEWKSIYFWCPRTFCHLKWEIDMEGYVSSETNCLQEIRLMGRI